MMKFQSWMEFRLIASASFGSWGREPRGVSTQGGKIWYLDSLGEPSDGAALPCCSLVVSSKDVNKANKLHAYTRLHIC
jgi:hypothetical protein